MTKYEERYYNDVNRIANAIEKIARYFENKEVKPNIITVNGLQSSPYQQKCPYCGSYNIQSMYGTIILDGKTTKTTHYMCKDCHKEFDV